MESRGVAGAAALEAIRIAFEIELGGMAFYQRAARETRRRRRCAICSTASPRWRSEHMATLSRRYHVDPARASADLHLDRAAVYAGIPNRPDEPDNLFRIAIAFEQRAATSSGGTTRSVPAGSAERELYKELAAEEREHVAVLLTELERWREGKPGLL